MKVTADNLICEVLHGKEGAAEVFMSYGSHCLNCSNVSTKKVTDMAKKHNVDLNTLLCKLNNLSDIKN